MPLTAEEREELRREAREVTAKQFVVLHDVAWFDRHGNGPHSVANVCVWANIHPSTHYPDQRISLGQYGQEPKEMDFGGVLMTIPQAIQLVKGLKQAIKEAVHNCPSLAIENRFDDLDGDELDG